MKHWLRYSILGIVVFALTLTAQFPIRLAYDLAGAFPARGPLVPHLYGLEGTLWSGNASLFSLGHTPIGALQWHNRPWWLLAGQWVTHWHLNTDEGGLEGNMHVGARGITLEDVRGEIPLSTIMPLLPHCPVMMGGHLSVAMESVYVELSGGGKAQGSVVWYGAEISLPQPLPLGNLRLTLQPQEGAEVVGRLSDEGGPLELSGEMRFYPDGRYRINALLNTRPSAPPELGRVLALLGKSDAQGRYRLVDAGRF